MPSVEWGQDQRGFAGGVGGDWLGGTGEASLGELGRRGGGAGGGSAAGGWAPLWVCAVRCCSHAARTATATSCLPGSTCTIWEDASVQMLPYYSMSYLFKGSKMNIHDLFMSWISILVKMWTPWLFWSRLNVDYGSLDFFFWMAPVFKRHRCFFSQNR